MSANPTTPPSNTQKIEDTAPASDAIRRNDPLHPSQVLVPLFTVDMDAIYRKRGIEKPSCTNVELKHKPCQK